MLGFIRKGFLPFSYIGRKISRIFNIGRKADVRNSAGFVNLAPEGLRFRPQGQEVMLGQGQAFFPNYMEATKQFNYGL